MNEQYKEGEILRQSIISPADILGINTEETQILSQSAREAIRPIFTFESNRAEQAIQSFRISWEKLVKHGSNTNSNAKANVQNEEKTEVHWTGAGGAEVGKVLSCPIFTANELSVIERALRESARRFDL